MCTYYFEKTCYGELAIRKYDLWYRVVDFGKLLSLIYTKLGFELYFLGTDPAGPGSSCLPCGVWHMACGNPITSADKSRSLQGQINMHISLNNVFFGCCHFHFGPY